MAHKFIFTNELFTEMTLDRPRAVNVDRINNFFIQAVYDEKKIYAVFAEVERVDDTYNALIVGGFKKPQEAQKYLTQLINEINEGD